VNVLEGVEKPEVTLNGLSKALAPGGKIVLLAPLGRALYGSVDAGMGQLRRFERSELERMLAGAGFEVEKAKEINKAGRVAWWISSKLFGRKRLSKLSLKIFDKTVWLCRMLDAVLPWSGLSVILVARKKG
jgi:hypothetical protein